MTPVVALDASPANVLRSFRGRIVGARSAYPQVLHLDVCDDAGHLWRFATQDTGFSPTDPEALSGRSIESADIDDRTGDLRCRLSDRSFLTVSPGIPDAIDDPPGWELITPDGLVLEFGPGVRWQIGSADIRASAR